MVLLDLLYKHKNFSKDIAPYLSSGIIIDTSVLLIYIRGLIDSQFSNKFSQEYDDLVKVFQLMKIYDEKTKFLITPHIFTELLSHIKNEYGRHKHFKKILEQIKPTIKKSQEFNVNKDSIFENKKLEYEKIEVGDISIFLTAENYDNNNRKMCLFEKDGKFLDEYGDERQENIMVIDYATVMSAIKEL